MVTVIIVFLLKYSVKILVGNKKVGKNFGRYENSRSKILSAEILVRDQKFSHFRPTFFYR